MCIPLIPTLLLPIYILIGRTAPQCGHPPRSLWLWRRSQWPRPAQVIASSHGRGGGGGQVVLVTVPRCPGLSLRPHTHTQCHCATNVTTKTPHFCSPVTWCTILPHETSFVRDGMRKTTFLSFSRGLVRKMSRWSIRRLARLRIHYPTLTMRGLPSR